MSPFGKQSSHPHENENDTFATALGGQASATFNAAAFKDLLTVFSAVSLHETMLNFTLALVRLISAFWHNLLSSCFYYYEFLF